MRELLKTLFSTNATVENKDLRMLEGRFLEVPLRFLIYYTGVMRAEIITNISDKSKSLLPTFSDERSRRLWAAADVQSLGRGGLNAVRVATGMD
ncbi:MAG: hypothetical protein LBJ67_09340 [Planctomycetaceae bacterium]|nr:hypothetical protein [Planctomycetaceae bacterium]